MFKRIIVRIAVAAGTQLLVASCRSLTKYFQRRH